MNNNIGRPGFTGESIPLTAGSLYGLRAFNVDPQNGSLHGLAFPSKWTTGENVAVCKHPMNKSTDHSMTGCDHGFWAYYGNHTEYISSARAAGIIEGYGEVVIGEKGFRSEKAQIRALVLPDPEKLFENIWQNVVIMAGFKIYKRDSYFSNIVTVVTSAILTLIALLGTYASLRLGNAMITGSLILAIFMIGVRGWDYAKELKPSREHYQKANEDLESLLSTDFNRMTYEALMGKRTKKSLMEVISRSDSKLKESYPGIQFYDSVEDMMVDYGEKIESQQEYLQR